MYENNKHISFVQLDDEIKKQTILINGVSKTYSMTGWRIGYAAGDPSVISAMGNLSGQSTSNPTSISQKAAQEAFSGSQDEVGKMVEEFESKEILFVMS